MTKQLTVQVSGFEKQLPRLVLENHEELKIGLIAMTDKYRDMVVTSDGIKDAKADRANLNRVADAINSARISAQKAWNKPMEAFKAACDELIKITKEPASAIDEQIKAYEEAEKEEKRAAITEFYAEHVGDLQNLVPLERLWDNKWLNKTVPLTDAQNAIYDRLDVVRHDLATIEKMDIRYKEYLFSAFTRHLNMGKALDERRAYEEEQTALAKRREEAGRQAASAVAPPAPPPAAQFPPEAAETPAPHTDVMRPIPPGIGVFPRHTVMKLYFDVPTEHPSAWKTEMRAVCDKYDVKRGWADNGNQ